MQFTIPFVSWRAARFLAVLAFSFASISAIADITFKSTSIKVATHPLKVELAVSDQERSRGLMYAAYGAAGCAVAVGALAGMHI